MQMICKSYGRNWGFAGHNQRDAGNGGIALLFHAVRACAALLERYR